MPDNKGAKKEVALYMVDGRGQTQLSGLGVEGSVSAVRVSEGSVGVIHEMAILL